MDFDQAQKNGEVTDEDLSRFYLYGKGKIDDVLRQLKSENAPDFDFVKRKLQGIKKELRNKYVDRSINIKTLLALSMKLCYWADYARIEPNSADKKNYKNYSNTSLEYIFFLPLTPPIKLFGKFSLDVIEVLFNNKPILPYLTSNGVFGMGTFMYAFSKGYILLGLAIYNDSMVHCGRINTFKDWNKVDYYGSNVEGRPGKQWTFKNSICSLKHDVDHIRRLEPFFRDNKIKSEIQEKYKNAYSYLNNNWHNIKNPKVVTSVLFWLLHEYTYTFNKHYLFTLKFFASEMKKSKLQSKYVIDQLVKEDIKNSNPHLTQQKKLQNVYQNIEHNIVLNHFDWAIVLNDCGYNIPIDENDTDITLMEIHKAMIDVMLSDEEIFKLLY